MPTQWKRKKIIKIENDDIKTEQIFQKYCKVMIMLLTLHL